MQAKNPYRGVKIFFIGWFSLLILSLTFIGIMGRLGYELIDAGASYLLFGLLVVSALAAGSWWLMGRIGARWLKILTGTAMGVIIAAAAVAMYVVFSVVLLAGVPGHYTTISNDGCHAVVMRRLHLDFDDGDSSRYSYSVHPRVAGFFYNKKISAAGELSLGVNSEARLMYAWQDENTIRLYTEGTAGDEGGELLLRFD